MKIKKAEYAIAAIIKKVEKRTDKTVTAIYVKKEKRGVGFGQTLSDLQTVELALGDDKYRASWHVHRQQGNARHPLPHG